MTFKERYYKFYGELYRFHEKYHAVAGSEEWAALAKEAGQISLKYPEQFETDMLSVVVAEIETKYKNNLNEGD